MSEQEVLELAEEIKTLQAEISLKTGIVKDKKDILRKIMKGADIADALNDKVSVAITYPKSFDVGILGYEYPDLYKEFTTIKTIITEKVEVNKKTLKKYHPEAYNECLVDLTARLSIK